ncbi:MAG: 3-isopropylmalate dehydrogenase, partial [Akkermansiaceae bacterium]|nr:3-isopropylmalate dehydrogenase [Akkermansiaceae bacterium]
AREECGADLSSEVEGFCEDIFSRQGAVLCGPGGGRFVYDLRARFDLFCKLTPVTPLPALADAGVMKASARRDVDLVVVRENAGGLYFGEGAQRGAGPERSADHRFAYREDEVARILEVAMRLAAARRGKIMLALKPGGVPAISALWQNCFQRVSAEHRVEAAVLEIDNAVYQVLEKAREFDVVVAPNMFADVLSDACSLLLGSRGMSFSGNFSARGHAVFQTGHGAAHDLAGKDEANPIGQVLSVAMMLRESFGLDREAAAIEAAVVRTVGAGWRTRDIAGRDSTVVGTREMGRRICSELERLLAAGRE